VALRDLLRDYALTQRFTSLIVSRIFVVQLAALGFALVILVVSTAVRASQDGKATTWLTAEILLKRAAVTGPQLQALQEGKVVTVGFSRLELTPEQLAATLLVLVSGKVPDVAAKIADRISLQKDKGASAGYDLEGETDETFRAAVVLGAHDAAEINHLLNVHPGDAYNFSTEEIAWFQTAAADLSQGRSKYVGPAETMTATLRRVLRTRYQAYRARGLRGVVPYDRGYAVFVDPAEGLRVALDSIDLLRGYFPRFYLAFRQYPRADSEGYQQRHLLIKTMAQGRQAFVLAHWVIDINESYALIAERQYYVSHTYDALQNIIACVPYRGETLVALLNQTFTGKVAGFARAIRHNVGRKRIQETIRPLFESLRDAFGKQEGNGVGSSRAFFARVERGMDSGSNFPKGLEP